MLTSSELAKFLIVFFNTYLVIDTTLGVFEYGEAFGVLSGWIHHIFYIGFLSHAYAHGYSVSFMYVLPMEFSSIFLAGGRLFKVLRQDTLFGALFIIFRVIYHAYLLYGLVILASPKVTIWPPVLGVFFLHLYWFYRWVLGQYKRTQKRK